MATRRKRPTREAYGELQQVYDLYNRELFAGKLPHCLMTLQRKGRRTYGYFSPKRFASGAGETTDEIALNPMWFRERDISEALQTVAHEMCHLWQHHFGTPSRQAYHNHEWAAKMIEVGLMPSDTGKPGGKIVGQHMGDYVIADGRFAAVTKKLLATGFRLTWHDTRDLEVAVTLGGETPQPVVKPTSASGKRVKYRCRACGLNAWAKPGIMLVCGECSDRPLMDAA